MKYRICFMIVLLLYVMCLQIDDTESSYLSTRPAVRHRRGAARSANTNVDDDRKRGLFNLGTILDPLLGVPITVKSVITEVLIFPVKQFLVSCHWTNEHVVRKAMQFALVKVNNLFDTYLDEDDLPIFVAFVALLVGTWAESVTKADTLLEKFDSFVSDVLDVIIGT